VSLLMKQTSPASQEPAASSASNGVQMQGLGYRRRSDQAGGSQCGGSSRSQCGGDRRIKRRSITRRQSGGSQCGESR
jgi:hypothetical protein